jgi:hypothetical protein
VPGLRGVGVVVVALLLDFLLGSGLLPVLPEEDFVQQATLLHQRLRGSGYGRPSRRSGEPSVDWVEWGYDYMMFKLFNLYIRQNLPPASSHINKQHTTNQYTTSQTTSTNNFITARGVQLGGKTRSRTTRPGSGLRAQLKQKRLGTHR